jgi:uncharacterized membrane protein YvlD (DUF360 family)
MTLTATAVKHAKPRNKPYKIFDEKGMFLLVSPSGSRCWRQKYRYAGKEKTLALGVYPDISLADARDKRDEARKALANDIDPGEVKKARKMVLQQEAEDSFMAIATEWYNLRKKDWSKSHRDRVWRALEKDLFPRLGNRPIAQISRKEVLRALRKIESRGALETAHRAKQTAGQIFQHAILSGIADRDPSVGLQKVLATPNKTHLAAITDPKEVGKLLVAMDGYSGTPVVETALLLSPLFFCRPVLVLLTLPFTILTLGLFLLLLNAGMLNLAGWFVDGFEVEGFWSAVFGAIVVSLASGLCSHFIGPRGRYEVLVIRRDN